MNQTKAKRLRDLINQHPSGCIASVESTAYNADRYLLRVKAPAQSSLRGLVYESECIYTEQGVYSLLHSME